jgi:hypothetical protein
METKLTIDLTCSTLSRGNPSYRVWLDRELMTERTWIWPVYDFFIQEQIIVNLEPGPHILRVENISGISKFTAKNLTVNGAPAYGEGDNLQFTIYS